MHPVSMCTSYYDIKKKSILNYLYVFHIILTRNRIISLNSIDLFVSLRIDSVSYEVLYINTFHTEYG